MTYTSEQKRVIEHDGAHAIVAAVAGSGKTHTMVGRIAYQLANGVSPKRILVLMFNKSAQEDFAGRLAGQCAGKGLKPAEVLTFHAFGLRLANRMVEQGLLEPAQLQTEGYALRKMARAVLEKVNAESSEDDQLDLSFEVVTEFLDTIDILKGELYPTDDRRWEYTVTNIDERFVRGFHFFECMRREMQMRTFSDMIYDPVMAALENPQIERFISGRYDHVIVDEFQDVNEAQMTLLRMLAGQRAAVMAVGDEDQCIYAWRGAKPDYMTRLFQKEFPNSTRYALSRTFRYGHKLSLAANFVISRNKNRTEKLCISGTRTDTALDVRLVRSSVGDEVLKIVREWREGGRQYSDAAILVREYAHTTSTEIALLQNKIPYRLVGASPFFDRAEVLGLRAYLQLAGGGLQFVETPQRRIRLVSALLTTPTLYLRKDAISTLSEAIAEAPDLLCETAEAWFKADSRSLPFSRERRLKAVETWRWVINVGPKLRAADFLSEVMSRTNLRKDIEKNVPDPREAAEKLRMLDQIVVLARERRESPAAFAAFLDRLTAEYSDSAADSDRVLITSCHRAKGLEWSMVILPELADGSFPVLRTGWTEQDLEDERRLFYVAATRAIERLVLLAPMDPRLLSASNKGVATAPDAPIASRFLYEANLAVAMEGLEKARQIKPDSRCATIIDRYRGAIASAEVAG
ncbi:MAG: ATP-dependent helicase [Propionivibrio sp.]|nr:ATP-dependent helicase [Propionivibrio sp.]